MLAGNEDNHVIQFGQIGPWTAELAALERLEKYPKSYNGRHVVNIPAP